MRGVEQRGGVGGQDGDDRVLPAASSNDPPLLAHPAGGGSRPPEMDLKNSTSSAVIARPSPAFSTVFQLLQLGCEKCGPNSLESAMVLMTL